MLSCARSSASIRQELSAFESGKRFIWIIERSDSSQSSRNIKKGSYITFGEYEQDNNNTNGKEDIEWLVLEVKDGKALVISKYILDCKQFNTTRPQFANLSVSWERCSLRKWLNDDFVNTAFSDLEKAMIPTVTVSADRNPSTFAHPGNATQDQVFLLSITEANTYFTSDSARQCQLTDYANKKGVLGSTLNNCCDWWLRTRGSLFDLAVYVDQKGDVNWCGMPVDWATYGVRPAMWIDLEP